MPNLYIDPQGRPMNYRKAVAGMQSGQLTPEQEIEQARQEMEEAGRKLQELKGPVRGIGGQRLAPVRDESSPTIGGRNAPEATLRERYDRHMEQDRQRVLEERRLGEAGDKRYAKFDPSGYRHPQTPMPAEKGTAAYESGYNRYASDVYKRRKKTKEDAENRRLELEKKRLKLERDRTAINESKAITKGLEAEAKEVQGKYYTEGGRKTEAKPPKMTDIDKAEYKRYADALKDMLPGSPEREVMQKKLDAISDKYKTTQAGGLRGKVQGTVQPTQGKIITYRDEKGNWFRAESEDQVPSKYRDSAKVYQSGDATLSGQALGQKTAQGGGKPPVEGAVWGDLPSGKQGWIVEKNGQKYEVREKKAQNSETKQQSKYWDGDENRIVKLSPDQVVSYADRYEQSDEKQQKELISKFRDYNWDLIFKELQNRKSKSPWDVITGKKSQGTIGGLRRKGSLTQGGYLKG